MSNHAANVLELVIVGGWACAALRAMDDQQGRAATPRGWGDRRQNEDFLGPHLERGAPRSSSFLSGHPASRFVGLQLPRVQLHTKNHVKRGNFLN